MIIWCGFMLRIVDVRLIGILALYKGFDCLWAWSVPYTYSITLDSTLTPKLHNEWSWLRYCHNPRHSLSAYVTHFQNDCISLSSKSCSDKINSISVELSQSHIHGNHLFWDYVITSTILHWMIIFFIKFNYLLLYVLLYCVVVNFFFKKINEDNQQFHCFVISYVIHWIILHIHNTVLIIAEINTNPGGGKNTKTVFHNVHDM